MPDFDAAFAETYGLPLREFFLILYRLYMAFKAHALQEKNPLLLDEASCLWPIFDKENVRRVLSHVCQTADELAINLLGTPRQNWATDCTPLREHPVIQVFEGKHACTDLDLLHRCLSDGMYFLLQKAYPDNAFGQLFGYIFQEYITRFFREFSYEGDVLWRTFYASPRFQGKQEEAGDGILIWERSALVMEYKARLLTTREKYGGVTEVLLRGVDDIIGKHGKRKGVYQLAEVIQRLLAGEKVVTGSPKPLDLKDCPRIHPVLVTYEEALGLEAVRQQAQAKFTSALRIDDTRREQVGVLLILTVDEVEILEGLALRHPAENIISEYAAYVTANPKNRTGSFRSFVCNSEYNKNAHNPNETLVGKCCLRALDQIASELKKRHAEAVARGELCRRPGHMNPNGIIGLYTRREHSPHVLFYPRAAYESLSPHVPHISCLGHIDRLIGASIRCTRRCSRPTQRSGELPSHRRRILVPHQSTRSPLQRGSRTTGATERRLAGSVAGPRVRSITRTFLQAAGSPLRRTPSACG